MAGAQTAWSYKLKQLSITVFAELSGVAIFVVAVKVPRATPFQVRSQQHTGNCGSDELTSSVLIGDCICPCSTTNTTTCSGDPTHPQCECDTWPSALSTDIDNSTQYCFAEDSLIEGQCGVPCGILVDSGCTGYDTDLTSGVVDCTCLHGWSVIVLLLSNPNPPRHWLAIRL